LNGKRQPTIIDVARLSGVSKTTVARVLSGVGAVHSETRRRVEEAVRDSGYERNHLAFGLRTGRSRTLGLVIPDLSNPYWADLARGAQDKAEAEKRSLLIFSSDWDTERERRHLQALRQARVDGILINPAVTDDVTLLRQTEAPVVVLGSSGEVFPEFSSARSDVAQGVRLALDHLIGLGHRHVGLIVGRDRLGRSRFVAEARAHWQRQGLDAALLPTEEAKYTVDSGQAATTRLFGREGPRVTAIFAANDLMAVGAILAARAAGLACPNDISIMGMDGVEAGSFTDPGLTTVDKPRYDIGVEATRLLLEAIDGTGETVHAVLPCRLVERSSVAAPPSAALRSARPSALGSVRKKSA
jgi:LacI family transcriptional regulator